MRWPSRYRTLLLLSLVLGVLGCRSGGHPASTSDSPNIVCIVIDTLRADHLPFYGYPENTAPFLGTLASRGIVFRHAQSPSSWTAPATASIFTSVYPFQHHVTTGLRASRHLRIEAHRIPDGLETLPELLHRSGYRTFGATDNLNICEEQGFAQGFDVFHNHTYEAADAVNQTIKGWAADIDGASKYFLYVHYMDPHVPYHRRVEWCTLRDDCSAGDAAAYDSEIHYVDERIADLAEHLGWNDNTLIIVVSDHGEEFRDHGGKGHGHTLYGELINVPLLIWYPARWSGPRSILTRVSTLDIVPTIADIIGAAPMKQYEGISLVPLLDGAVEGEIKNARDRLFYAHLLRRRKGIVGNHGPLLMRSLIQGDWKLITSSLGPSRLYNVAEDPLEQHDRIAEQPDIAARLHAQIDELESSAPTYAGARTTITLSADENEKLRALGYVE